MDNRFFLYKKKLYPTCIKHGHAADHIIPIAKHFCKGKGLDIGGQKDCHFPGARIINMELHDEYDALCLPNDSYDYIFSSHTLEHIKNWQDTLAYWRLHLNNNGVLFLYLPHPDMEYWLPENCEKHANYFSPNVIEKELNILEFKNILVSERDLFFSFAAVGIKE